MTMPAVQPPRTGATRARLLRDAARIGARLSAQAAEVRDGSVTWLAPPAEDAPARPLDTHLYGGATGIAFFLAALDHARGTAEHAPTVRRALAPLLRSLRGLRADPARAAALRVNVGGLVGAGSWIYALARIGAWLGDEEMLDGAHAAAALLTPARIDADDRLDVTKGAAGAILALLTLHALDPRAGAAGHTPLEVAARCGAHLLACRRQTPARPRAWTCPGVGPLTGFAHGASGIGLALLRLSASTGDGAPVQAALEGFAYERTLYLSDLRDWWDPRFDRPLRKVAWCYGAPGMALARAAARHDRDAAADLALMTGITRHHDDEPVDTLCCGTLGRADVLLTLSRALADPSLAEGARTLTRRVLRRAGEQGDYALLSAESSPLGLFTGAAGIGYALLRQAAPALPSPLCLD